MILRNIAAFIGLVVGMSLFVFIWLSLDYFTKGL